MKRTTHIIIFAIALFAFMASAHAQSPREQLTQMVEQLQKTPSDNALREKIIKLVPTIKPAPALPDEAQRREGRGKFAFKNAKSNDDYLSAAREYEEAVGIAPWVTGYYSDLCTIYEKAEKYVEAKRNCEFSLIGLTDPSQVNEIKQRIAGLEFGIEKANSPAVKEAAQAARDEALVRSLNGVRFNCPTVTNNSGTTWTLWYVVNGNRLSEHSVVSNPNHVLPLSMSGQTEAIPIRGIQARNGSDVMEISSDRVIRTRTYNGETIDPGTCMRSQN